MAYDPNDPKDVEFLNGEIQKATERLQTKNSELIGELRKAREGKVDPALVERLERDLEKVQGELEVAQKAAKTAEADTKKLTTRAETAETRTNQLLTSTALNKAMAEAKIAEPLREGVQAMFGTKATVKVENGVETVMIGDKTASDALKEFAASDVGKHYVAAANNGGGGSQGGGADRGAKSMSRADFDSLDPQGKMDFSKAGGTLTET